MSDTSRPRNIVLKLALCVLSTAIFMLGALGWADKAHFLDAWRIADPVERLAALHPLWPLYAVAAVGCFAAQVVAACAAVNFARLARDSKIWRALCLGFFAASAFFAAYSADIGAQTIFGAPHRAAYEARQQERAGFEAEIAAINTRLGEAARLLHYDPTTTMTSRQAGAKEAFEALTAVDRARLPIAQGELDRRPPLPRDRKPAEWEGLVFYILLVWAMLEPWGYALAERGRVEAPHLRAPQRRRRRTEKAAAPRPAAKPVTVFPRWARRGLAALPFVFAPAAAAASQPGAHVEAPAQHVAASQRAGSSVREAVTPQARKRGPSAPPCSYEVVDGAARVLTTSKVRVSIRNLAKELGVPPSRVERSEWWKRNYAKA